MAPFLAQPAGSDTIYALASGHLPAGVAVVRISGPSAAFVCRTLTGTLPEPRKLALVAIRDAQGGLVDKGLAAWFKAPASFTGEDCLELHLHGGRATVAALFAVLRALPGMRAAEAGEFSRRAFFNGKMDLVQAEALADLISAETEAQRRFAVENTGGRLSSLYAGWRGDLMRVRALVEASLDFSDESDVPDDVAHQVDAQIAVLANAIGAHIEQFHRAEILRDGLDVVILGRPNAGKSTLLNALARRDVAIVSDEPGTTRDLLEAVLDLGGFKVRITDTAGLRSTESKVERMGVERAVARAGEADVVLILHDLSNSQEEDAPAPDNVPIIHVGSKCDLANSSRLRYDHHISASTGQGIDTLLDLLASRAEVAAGKRTELIPARERHVVLLQAGFAHLGAARAHDADMELKAEELRLAEEMIGRIIGVVDVEDLLGEIFSRFCIGK